MKPPIRTFQILLLSSGTTYRAEVIAGWRLSEAGLEDPHPCEVTHYNFDAHHDSLNILRLLDKVRDGFSRGTACYLQPPLGPERVILV